ncbi:hypothetical protein OSSY52_12090 [Tepiditoga spiralis]|uniref:Uncharacterized protein n=1 Tax=Tepiditoga spiralis TaxID=2108365 RepID=A0A7G1G3P8_9BACT|nr:DUF4897 domain-containing protein [Tepiditoga spiralis]BBE31068.1 hypothetical protein OSSY52_12090 [Tepiditoga spiralis]
MQKNLKNKGINFTIMTILFIAAILILNLSIFKSGSYKYDILSKNIIFNINENGITSLKLTTTIKAQDKKSFNYLLNGYKRSDIEKSKGYEKIFNEKNNKNIYCKVLNYKSIINTSELNIFVEETMDLSGIINKNNNELIFNFPIKRLNIDANSNLYVYLPENWTLKESIPTPSKNLGTYLLWNNVGTIDFSKIVLNKK